MESSDWKLSTQEKTRQMSVRNRRKLPEKKKQMKEQRTEESEKTPTIWDCVQLWQIRMAKGSNKANYGQAC